ncbi:hypothetical protein LRY65_02270 [Candidatus Woesebacteria bacterium]|nr:hypothetical protein [Candidatus Woesebacteria bacterium]
MTSRFVQNRDIFAVGEAHVLIPHTREANFGHNVSHAKNRTNRLFRPNLRTMTLDVEGEKKSFSITNRDARTYKKIMASYVQE